jgi:hypothetical protein
MTARQGILGVVAVGLIMLLLSFSGVASDFLTGIALNIDGLLLLAISLMVAVIFLAMLFLLAKSEGWLGKPKAEKAAVPASAASAPAKSQQPAQAK